MERWTTTSQVSERLFRYNSYACVALKGMH